MSERLPGIPSTSTRALGVAPNEPTPRIRISPESSPGLPEVCRTVTPGIWPMIALVTEGVERFCNLSAVTVEMEPTTLTFFSTP